MAICKKVSISIIIITILSELRVKYREYWNMEFYVNSASDGRVPHVAINVTEVFVFNWLSTVILLT